MEFALGVEIKAPLELAQLKQPIKNFFKTITGIARDNGVSYVSMTKKEFSRLVGKDIRTVSRYINTLEDKNFVQQQGIRGRGGKHVIFFNPERVRFPKNDNAIIHSGDPTSIDEAIEEVKPKRKKDLQPKKKNRRTQKQKKNDELDMVRRKTKQEEINDRLEKDNGSKVWDILQDTEDPVGNYRTYLISRLYNYYKVLFTKEFIEGQVENGEETNVKYVTNDYDILPKRFYKSSTWTSVEEIRKKIEEWDISPGVFLSAQFQMFRLMYETRRNTRLTPYLNNMLGDKAFENLRSYHKYYYFSEGLTMQLYQEPPAMYMDHVMVRAIINEYNDVIKEPSLMKYKREIREVVRIQPEDSAKQEAATLYYHTMDQQLKDSDLPVDQQHELRKFIGLQTLIQTRGVEMIPDYLILGNKMIQYAIDQSADDSHEDDSTQEVINRLPMIEQLLYPREGNVNDSLDTYLQMEYDLYTGSRLLEMIVSRRGLQTSVKGVSLAMKAFGEDRIPVTDESLLDLYEIHRFMEEENGGPLTDGQNPEIGRLEGDLTNLHKKKSFKPDNVVEKKEDETEYYMDLLEKEFFSET